MPNIDDAVAAYVAASDLCDPVPLIALKGAVKAHTVVGATQIIGRVAGHVQRGGGAYAERVLSQLSTVGAKLMQAHSQHAQLINLIDELIQDFIGLQGELAGIAAQIAASGTGQ